MDFFENRPFDVFHGHDIFSQGQQYHSWSISNVFELLEWFSDHLVAQKREKLTKITPISLILLF